MEIPWIRVGRPDAGVEVVVMGSRLELASAWRSPVFLVHSLRLWRQALRASGAVGVSLRAEPFNGVFWTLSAWTDRQALSAYAKADPHGATVARIRPWMKGATFRFWSVPVDGLRSAELWAEAVRRIAEEERE